VEFPQVSGRPARAKVVPFDTKVTPQDPKFVAEIERLLAER
jgi:hypothetical protein